MVAILQNDWLRRNKTLKSIMQTQSSQKVQKELRQLKQDPPPDVEVFQENDRLAEVSAKIRGPENTPYEGGEFRVRLFLPAEYPAQPPKAVFLTRIFHPNVATNGDICVNVLKREWKPDYGLRNVFQVIRCLLIEPNPESALNEEAGRLIMENFDDYRRQAALLTKVHAKIGANCLSLAKQPKQQQLSENLSQEENDSNKLQQQQQQHVQKNQFVNDDSEGKKIFDVLRTPKKRPFEQNVENQVAQSGQLSEKVLAAVGAPFTPTKKRKIMTMKSPKTSRGQNSLRRL
eukprot:TRINITY_DN6976_c0_g1_i3.p1 TRINITY_DN6976_c0_g1~~TRINITY_DN6976_c0_g1_i3.p1  ORF type:complete len:288 (+),score=41.77 TRINITY_DN6976_c0_g1_i3:54-917(+)